MLWLMMLAAAVAANVPVHDTAAIGVYIDFDAVPSARSVEVMKQEAGKIMHDAGYMLDWRALKDNQGKDAYSHVVVVKFHGKCRIEYSPFHPLGDETPALASTAVQDGHVLPFSEVQCDQIRRMLEPGTPPDRQKAFGLALGRVVAHELYHLLADTTKHAGSGLSKATHDWFELFAGHSGFSQSELPHAFTGH